jgi:glycosyltransferase involved in cell wall biosynthesis
MRDRPESNATLHHRVRVLLSAYACEPDKGSEPGVGWAWANGLADRVELHVLTRCSNRPAIEAALQGGGPGGATFHYFDLGRVALWLKSKRLLPTFAYYVFWQLKAARRFKELAESMDVVHHLTFCNLLCPGAWRLQRAAFVIGPVGAPLVPQVLLPLFGRAKWAQMARGAVIRRFDKLPGLRSVLRGASAIVPANSETAELLRSRGFETCPVILDTGSPEVPPPSAKLPSDAPVRFVYAGRLERRKGIELSLRALAVARDSGASCRFLIVGSGPDEGRLRRLTDDLDLGDRVEFLGHRTRNETLGILASADVFLFTSLRDTSGGVNLEAMASGLPVVCLSHQGVRDITDDSCADRIEPGPIPGTVSRLSAAIVRQCEDSERRRRMGECARLRAETAFSWEDKFERMLGYYSNAIHSRKSAS